MKINILKELQLTVLTARLYRGGLALKTINHTHLNFSVDVLSECGSFHIAGKQFLEFVHFQGSNVMPRKPQDIPDAELAVLQQLWERGACTVRQLTEVLYPTGPGSQNATVQKLLDRLEAKQYVSRNRDSWPYLFQAMVQRGDVIRKSLQATADKLCSGALAPLLTHLVRTESLSVADRESLRDLLQELDQNPESGANLK